MGCCDLLGELPSEADLAALLASPLTRSDEKVKRGDAGGCARPIVPRGGVLGGV